MTKRDRRVTVRRKKVEPVPKERRFADERRKGERRENCRVPLELWMEEISGEDVYFRQTGNVSEGGVYFDKAIPHTIGTVVTLKFALPGNKEMLVARGKVVSAASGSEGLGMSVQFISIEGNGRERLQDFMQGRKPAN